MTMASSVVVLPFLKSGKIRVLAATGKRRVPAMPDTPTVAEAGLAGFEEGNWQMVLVPSKTPRAVINKLNRELVRIVKLPDMTEHIARVGADVIADTPEEATAVLRTDMKKYADIIKALNIRVE